MHNSTSSRLPLLQNHRCPTGVIAGLIMHVFVKFFTFKLFNFQRKWPGGAAGQLQQL
jgi:hypothetical protein